MATLAGRENTSQQSFFATRNIFPPKYPDRLKDGARRFFTLQPDRQRASSTGRHLPMENNLLSRAEINGQNLLADKLQRTFLSEATVVRGSSHP